MKAEVCLRGDKNKVYQRIREEGDCRYQRAQEATLLLRALSNPQTSLSAGGCGMGGGG